MSAQEYLPLASVEFHVLLSLAEQERHGYGIIQDAEARTRGADSPDIGTLYRALRRMVDNGLIEASARRPAADQDDERRNYYRITKLGREVAKAEAARMASLVKAARASRLLQGSRP
jgi:DNA-binding PadR family transcriptional regulator